MKILKADLLTKTKPNFTCEFKGVFGFGDLSKKNELTFIDFCSGIGGSRLGLEFNDLKYLGFSEIVSFKAIIFLCRQGARALTIQK